MLTYCLSLDDGAEQKAQFEEIYYSYRKQMHYVALKITKSNELAEDAVQEAFLGLAKNFDHICLDNDKMVRAYVLVAAKNYALNIMKSRYSICQNECCSIDDEDWENTINHASSDWRNLEDELIKREVVQDLIKSIEDLPNPYAEALTLKYVHNLKEQEIAEILNASVSLVYQWVSRGKKKIVKNWKETGKYASLF